MVIRNGKKMPNCNIKELDKFRKQCKAAFLDEANKCAGELFAIVFLDEYVKVKKSGEPHDYLFEKLRKRSENRVRRMINAWLDKDAEMRDVCCDFRVRMSFYPQKDKTLVLPRFHNHLLGKVEIPCVQEYAYWDDGEKPSWTTNKEWEKRKSDWSEALQNLGGAENKGIIIDILTPEEVTFLGYMSYAMHHLLKRGSVYLSAAKHEIQMRKYDELYESFQKDGDPMARPKAAAIASEFAQNSLYEVKMESKQLFDEVFEMISQSDFIPATQTITAATSTTPRIWRDSKGGFPR